MATHSCVPAWEIPWTGEPGGLQSQKGRKRVGHDLAAKLPPREIYQQSWNCIISRVSSRGFPSGSAGEESARNAGDLS